MNLGNDRSRNALEAADVLPLSNGSVDRWLENLEQAKLIGIAGAFMQLINREIEAGSKPEEEAVVVVQ